MTNNKLKKKIRETFWETKGKGIRAFNKDSLIEGDTHFATLEDLEQFILKLQSETREKYLNVYLKQRKIIESETRERTIAEVARITDEKGAKRVADINVEFMGDRDCRICGQNPEEWRNELLEKLKK